MAATANSPYQAARLQHIAGKPPLADPQRSTETFAAYKARMLSLGLWPDIDTTESDSAYLARIATYFATAPVSASYAASVPASGVVGTVATATSASFASTATSASYAP